MSWRLACVLVGCIVGLWVWIKLLIHDVWSRDRYPDR